MCIVLYLHVWHVSCGGQRRTLDLLELELWWMFLRQQISTENWIQVCAGATDVLDHWPISPAPWICVFFFKKIGWNFCWWQSLVLSVFLNVLKYMFYNLSSSVTVWGFCYFLPSVFWHWIVFSTSLRVLCVNAGLWAWKVPDLCCLFNMVASGVWCCVVGMN